MRNWTTTETISPAETYAVEYRAKQGGNYVTRSDSVSFVSKSKTVSEYTKLTYKDKDGKEQQQDVVFSTISTTTTCVGAANGARWKSKLEAGSPALPGLVLTKRTETFNKYTLTIDGPIESEVTTYEYEPRIAFAGGLAIESYVGVDLGTGNVLIRKTIVEKEENKAADLTLQITTVYQAWGATAGGKATASAIMNALKRASDAERISGTYAVVDRMTSLVCSGAEKTINIGRGTTPVPPNKLNEQNNELKDIKYKLDTNGNWDVTNPISDAKDFKLLELEFGIGVPSKTDKFEMQFAPDSFFAPFDTYTGYPYDFPNFGPFGRDDTQIGPNLTDTDYTGIDYVGFDFTNFDFTNADLTGSDFSDLELPDIDFTNADLTDVDFSNTDLTNADLSNTDLNNADLTNADLANANLTNADLTNANLTNANLTNTDLRNANLTNANLTNANLTRADARGANFTGANLSGADASFADMTAAKLRNANLFGVNFTSTNLTRADLQEANLTNAILTNANLTRANLKDANFTNATLNGANLTETYANGANFTDADLIGTSLTKSDLREADLTNAVFTNANLTDANMTGATTTGAVLTGANLSGAYLSTYTGDNDTGLRFQYNSSVDAAYSYGKTINTILSGMANGKSITTELRNLPSEPMGTIYLEAAGTVGRFRANGTTFAWDSQGLVAGCDAMLDGGAGLLTGASGADWFPLVVPAANLPTVTPTTNASPALANTISAPNGFDPMAPGNIWASFGTAGVEGDVYAAELTVANAVGAVVEVVRRESVCRSLTWLLEAAYDLTPVTVSLVSVSVTYGTLSTFTVATNPGVAWVTNATLFLPGDRRDGQGYNDGVAWVTPSTTFTPGGANNGPNPGVAWVTPATTFTPGARNGGVGFNPGVAWVTPATTFTPGARSDGRTVLLLLHMDGADNGTTFTDSSLYARTITHSASAFTRTNTKKFGTASLRGNNGCLHFSPAITLDGDFTIATWFSADDITQDQALFGADLALRNQQIFRLNEDGITGNLIAYSNAYLWNRINSYLSGLNSGVFNHYELTRQGATVRLFINGNLLATVTFSGSISIDTIGAGYAGSSNQIYGNMDEVIILSECLHTASFTPPTAPYSIS